MFIGLYFTATSYQNAVSLAKSPTDGPTEAFNFTL